MLITTGDCLLPTSPLSTSSHHDNSRPGRAGPGSTNWAQLSARVALAASAGTPDKKKEDGRNYLTGFRYKTSACNKMTIRRNNKRVTVCDPHIT